MRRVNGGQCGLNLRRRVNAGDERSLQLQAIARGGGGAFEVHVIVDVAQIFAEVIDGNADGHGRRRHAGFGLNGGGRGFEIGNALAEHGNEIAHDMVDGMLHTEDVGVQIALGNAPADLAGQAGIQLILGNGFENGALIIRIGRVGIEGHVNGLGGHGNLIDLLPRPFEIGSARRNHAHLRVAVPRLFLLIEGFGNGVFERGGLAHAFGAAKAGFHRAFVLVHGVKPGDKITNEEPGNHTDHAAEEDGDHNEFIIPSL